MTNADAGGSATPDQIEAGPGDPTVAAAVELDDRALRVATEAAVEEAGEPDLVGDVVDVYAEDGIAVTARFQALVDGYRGWLWSVTIALLDADHPTVSEVVLLPGPDALLAPAWVPWEQRIRSGDLGVGDLLPAASDDPRLVPAYVQSDDPAVEAVALEIGLGRVRVLSRDGREDAAERWHDGPFGPDDDMAVHAPGRCATCAFYLPLAGSLGAGFGACGNEYSPADGRVVDAGYGCGAHSETIGAARSAAGMGDVVVDELRLEVHQHEAVTESPEDAVSDGAEPGAVTESPEDAVSDGAGPEAVPGSGEDAPSAEDVVPVEDSIPAAADEAPDADPAPQE